MLLAAIVALGVACDTIGKAVDFLDSISDGASCEANIECWGQRCLTAGQGYPGGYCTTLDCETSGCSGFNSECFRTKIDEQQVSACYELCEVDGTCRRADEGYTCVVLDDLAVCLPPNVTNAPVQGAIGSPCSKDMQCGEGGTCLTNFFGGYCTQLGCDDGQQACPSGSACTVLNPEADAADQVTGCLASCSTESDCRYGYACLEFAGNRVCLEGDQQSSPRNPDGSGDGEPCVANLNCMGGTCVREVETADGGTSFPDGYCTTRGCKSDDDCSGEGICVSRERSTSCMAACSADTDCRDGYVCRQGIEGRSFCDSRVEYVAPDTSGSNLFEIQCGSSKQLTFTLPQGTLGFYVAPFTRDGKRVTPKTLRRPDGQTLNIERDYAFHAINPLLLESLAPILFPASNDSKFANVFGPGEYTLTVESQASEVCYYVIPKTAAGRKLDVNIYLVGVPGLTAATAPGNRNMQQVVETMRQIYSSMGVDVSVARYIDPERSVVESYSIVRDIADIFTLVATSEAPGGSAEENLVVNVFLIEDFNVADTPGLLGVSAGLPGMAGVHGSSGSGLVFSTASLGRDNGTLGQTMAHEIGHFLGLRHTTEHMGSAHDPITDTPTCLFPNLGYICPDARNFMFPFSLGSDQRQTTAGQSFVIKRSPLVK